MAHCQSRDRPRIAELDLKSTEIGLPVEARARGHKLDAHSDMLLARLSDIAFGRQSSIGQLNSALRADGQPLFLFDSQRRLLHDAMTGANLIAPAPAASP